MENAAKVLCENYIANKYQPAVRRKLRAYKVRMESIQLNWFPGKFSDLNVSPVASLEVTLRH